MIHCESESKPPAELFPVVREVPAIDGWRLLRLKGIGRQRWAMILGELRDQGFTVTDRPRRDA